MEIGIEGITAQQAVIGYCVCFQVDGDEDSDQESGDEGMGPAGSDIDENGEE